MRKANYRNNASSDCIHCKGYQENLPKFLQYFSNRNTMENPTLDQSHIELFAPRATAIRSGWREGESRLKQKSAPYRPPYKRIQLNALNELPVKSKSEDESKSEEKLRSIEEKLEEAQVKCRKIEARLECLRLECSNYITKVIDTF